MENHLPVLIVGAGPTGLSMACLLAHYGVEFRIIDKNATPVSTSNATWIKPLSIELFDLLAVTNPFVKLGHHCNAINLHAGDKLSLHIPLNHIDSIYPYILMLPQNETEKLLIEHLESLKCQVERSKELVDIKQNADQTVTSTFRYPNGKFENITSHWLIACDGSNSVVRNKCQIFLQGEDLPEQFIVADAQMDSFHTHNEVHAFFDKKTIFVASPLGSKRYRIMANIHQSHPRKFFIEKEVREIVSERTHGIYNVHSVSWIFPFWIHSKIATKMQQGSIFLAGDAAHIHSPASGQGMNAGIQDAFNLAWKLALVIQGKAKPSLLNSYTAERYPVVKNIVNKAEYLTKISLFDNNFLSKLKKYSTKISAKKIQKVAMEITLMDSQQQNSPIIEYSRTVIKKKIKAGIHAPNVRIDYKTTLYHYLDSTRHHVILFTGITPEKNKYDKLLKLQKWLNHLDTTIIKAHIVTPTPLTGVENVILDSNNVIHTRYHIKYSSVYIIRPDSYIAYYSKILNRSRLKKFLQLYLNNIT